MFMALAARSVFGDGIGGDGHCLLHHLLNRATIRSPNRPSRASAGRSDVHDDCSHVRCAVARFRAIPTKSRCLFDSTASLLIAYCVLIVAASILGGKLTTLLRMTHLRTQMLMSGVGGLMIGIAWLHLLPHGGALLRSHSKAGAGALIGLTVMFLMIRLFHTHDHGVPATVDGSLPPCDHPGHSHPPAKGIGWAGLFLGLLLHTMVDGVALASSVLADAEHGAWLGLAGLGTFLAVALHKPLDAFAITSVMGKQHWPRSAQNLANLAFSLACPAGGTGVLLRGHRCRRRLLAAGLGPGYLCRLLRRHCIGGPATRGRLPRPRPRKVNLHIPPGHRDRRRHREPARA